MAVITMRNQPAVQEDATERGMNSCKVVTAVARELCGFIWAVVQQVRQQQAAGYSIDEQLACHHPGTGNNRSDSRSATSVA